jgi:hypothetical protein|tara:strand:+ start:61 stop:363 length:303 start_codon:yes stop_codon:yes gene_type:complete
MEVESLGIAGLIGQYGFPVVMSVGMGYFIFFIWKFINEHIDPALGDMHIALIRVIDKTRMLDQDMIRLQQKVNVVLEYREIYGKPGTGKDSEIVKTDQKK